MKTICVYHSRDLDGFMSAAIVKKWAKNNRYHVFKNLDTGEEEGNMVGDPNIIDFLGWDYGEKVPDLSGYEKVIICDISFSKQEMENLHRITIGNLEWIDHHISAINEIDGERDMGDNMLYGEIKGLRNSKISACELTWEYFYPNEKMPEIVRLLGMYDSFRHKGTDEEQDVLEFQYAARQRISDYEDAYSYLLRSFDRRGNDDMLLLQEEGRAIYQYLCTEAKQIYAKSFPVYFHEHITPTRAVSESKYKFLAVNRERFNPINFGIDYHKDGYDGFACFHWDGVKNKWCWSLYSDNGKTDVSQIAKERGGGGHFGAAGFTQDKLEFVQ